MWARLGLALAEALGIDDVVKTVAMIGAGVTLAVLMGLLFLPALLVQAPVAALDHVRQFFAAARAPDLHGVAVPWREVMAVWTAVHGQDLSGATPERVQAFARHWIEEDCTTDRQGKRTCAYRLRPLGAVQDALGLTPDERSLARNYLDALQAQSFVPPGWQPRPAPGWAWPLPGSTTVSSPFGLRIHPVLNEPEVHHGIDVAAPAGARVVAAQAGTVATGYDATYGTYVLIVGGGFVTLYGHLERAAVRAGQRVEAGQGIGTVGNEGLSTGSHLHFGLAVGARPDLSQDWQDPLALFGGA